MNLPASQLPASQAEIETAKTLTAIAETARRARHEGPGLPHPYETDRNLAQHLTAAAVAANGGGVGGIAGRIGRAVLTRLLPSQIAYNHALVDVIHQLDHRDRQQREEIADLQQQLAALADHDGRS